MFFVEDLEVHRQSSFFLENFEDGFRDFCMVFNDADLDWNVFGAAQTQLKDILKK